MSVKVKIDLMPAFAGAIPWRTLMISNRVQAALARTEGYKVTVSTYR